ncbi:hypothetical protein LSTR_LSTR017039 [Laodelphax striatellus]|uniref:Vps16 N-terminal domain-containing protein n=1 Tax=Laodelphax striatellus TaxID=195883 RepID=A0A482WFL3_LAOST|nr:hypothetical protein LSTR_LSTR017039 [Laodelphax striatellus]
MKPIIIASSEWNSGHLVKIGWSSIEELLCIQDDGNVLIYDMFSNYQHTFRMGQEAQDSKVIEARIFTSGMGTTGIAVLTASYRMFVVNSYKEPKVRRLSSVSGYVAPTAWEVVSEERNTRVLFARGSELYVLNESEQRAIQKHIDLGDDTSLMWQWPSRNHKENWP